MKRFFGIVFMLLLIGLPILAQVVDPPSNLGEAITNINTYMGTFYGLAALSVFVTGLFVGLFKVTNKVVKQVIAFIVPVALAVVVGNIFKIPSDGFLADISWWKAVIYGLGAGLGSMGLFSIDIIGTFIQSIFNYKKQ